MSAAGNYQKTSALGQKRTSDAVSTTSALLAVQMGFALLVLAAVVALFAFLPPLIGRWWSRPRANRP